MAAAGAVAGPAPAAPVLPVVPAAPAVPELTSETSGSTPAPLGSSRPMAAESAVKSLVRTLTTIALPAGAPSAWAVASDTTALTPPMPSVPKATTRSRFAVRPPATTVPPSGILSSFPIV